MRFVIDASVAVRWFFPESSKEKNTEQTISVLQRSRLTDSSSAKRAITMLISRRALPAILIDLLASFLDGLFHRGQILRVNDSSKT